MTDHFVRSFHSNQISFLHQHKIKMKMTSFCSYAGAVFFINATVLFHNCIAYKVGETCLEPCGAGLLCEGCIGQGDIRPRCVRTQPTNPFSKMKGLPFNRYSWLTTHKAFARSMKKSATGAKILSPINQEDSITSQLNHGVRGFMLDMYDFKKDIWLCHSTEGKCFSFTAFQPAINVLKEIQVFLRANPSEIVTIIIEDYVTSPNGLTKIFNAAGLRKYWFPKNLMPKDGSDWPTVDDMVVNNHRLVVFSSNLSKESSEGIPYKWNYIVENQYGNGVMKAGLCRNRVESPAMNSTMRSLVLMNYFSNIPDVDSSCIHNTAALISMVHTCYEAAGKRWPNFISVDFYKHSDGGGAPQAVDTANGQLMCGCPDISYCKEDKKFGSCDRHH